MAFSFFCVLVFLNSKIFPSLLDIIFTLLFSYKPNILLTSSFLYKMNFIKIAIWKTKIIINIQKIPFLPISKLKVSFPHIKDLIFGVEIDFISSFLPFWLLYNIAFFISQLHKALGFESLLIVFII
jgi:hypothetical protein